MLYTMQVTKGEPMGHIKPKRTICFITADGQIHKTKKAADLHVARIALDLERAKKQLKEAVEKQKDRKQTLKAFISAHRHRLQTGWGTHLSYVSSAQKDVAYGSDEVRMAARLVENLKKRLRGEPI